VADADLGEYRRKRDAARTPEPVPHAGPLPQGNDDTFVIQEHHARALHWDFRLERGGVLVSWAVPKGLPQDPRTNHLAVHTEDHPLEYADFAGDIPAGEYGGGSVTIWDRGTYETETWSEREVKVVLHGARVEGRFALFRTRGKDWMVHRMGAPARPDWQPLPALVRPMLAVPGPLPDATDDDQWAYETKWDGVRAVAYVEGGRLRLLSRNDLDITRSYPELRALGEALGATQVVLDGEIVAFAGGRADFGRLQQRMHVSDASQARRLAQRVPVVYLVFDVLHLDGRTTTDLPLPQRRELLEGLQLAGPAWQVPPSFVGGGADVLLASQENGLEGVVAKRLTSTYRPGIRSPDWRKIKNFRTQEVVVVGWKPGAGRRAGLVGSLVLAVNDESGLVFCGAVGTGFTHRSLNDLGARLRPLGRESTPLRVEPPRSARLGDVHWVEPLLVGEVEFAEWTGDGRLRHPSWRGLRPDKTAHDVRREP
jgi:bifunctional non-homologous end joining protein LigD